MENRTCSKCGETKPAVAFHTNSSQPSGFASQCKRCTHRASREWKKRNPDKVLAQVARWNAKNPGKRKAISLAYARKNKERLAAAQKLRHELFPERKHDVYLKATYGVPYGTYARLLSQQEGRCAICGATDPGRKQKRFHLDHCHETNKIRGLLCGNCNNGIAHLKHSEEILLLAIKYLRLYY